MKCKKVQRIGKEVDSQTSVELVEELHSTMNVQDICIHLGISRASYYHSEEESQERTS